MNRQGVPTEVNGNQFRSRTEARFAVLLSLLGLEWKYEPGIVKLPTFGPKAIWYAPDFVVPHLGVHIEVKPNLDVALMEITKPGLLRMWPTPVLIWCWDQGFGDMGWSVRKGDWTPPSFNGRISIIFDVAMGRAEFGRCPLCNRVGLFASPTHREEEAWQLGCGCMDESWGQDKKSAFLASAVSAVRKPLAIARGWRPVDHSQTTLWGQA